MIKKKITITLLLLLSLYFNPKIQGQLSKKHFIPPLTSSEFGNANPENQFFYLSTPSTKNVSYTITPIGQPDSEIIRGVVSKTSPKEIFIGTGSSQLFVQSSKTSTVSKNKGYIIEANNVIYVSVRIQAGDGSQAGALVSKGENALGDTFRVGAYTNENPDTSYLSFVSVMATENNTNISFSDLPSGISIKNYSGTLPIDINLNEGESYIVAVNSSESEINKDGLIGTLVRSNKPIVVNSGSTNGSFHNGDGRDYGFDQIADFSRVGREYIFVKGFGDIGWENVLIVAHLDNTSIIINGTTSFTTINAGEYFLIEGDSFNSLGNMYVQTTNPVFAYQGIGGIGAGGKANESNQGLFFVPPLNCENKGKVDNIPFIRNIGTTIFTGGISVVTNKGAKIKINNNLITNLDPSSPLEVTGPMVVSGNSDYVTYKIIGIDNDVSVESTGELYCSYFNQNRSATSGGYYTGFPFSPEIEFKSTSSSLGNCIPNITLEVENENLYDTFEWFFDDGSGSGMVSTSIRTPSFKPLIPGKYQLKAIIACTNREFFSIEIPVNLCPDDYDGDLVIDNLDIDIDNDGILNCDESKGNAIINLTSFTKPLITFKDGTSNNTIASANYSQINSEGIDNTFNGDNLGNFTSTLNTGKTSNSEYEMFFLENINFKFSQNKSKKHIVTLSEFFIIKVGPKNKNITLLDPDNQLLIDTNFDNQFEAGITSVSAPEIRFKYVSDIRGEDATFQFIANSVTKIIFEHNSNTSTSNSIFNGSIELTCFSLDSDNDGVPNSIDLDSDNDGIPDLYDAFGKNISLLNSDANLDGLDDIFETKSTNLDFDNDGINNYLDIDSDNDGIFDTSEAGHKLDLDFNGFVDSFIDSNKNGLSDILEGKKSIINFTISDSDSDSMFNFNELDSDNDSCLDVNEAGFTDNDIDGILDTSVFAVNKYGKLTNNLNGYTEPNNNYVIAAPILLNKPFEDVTFCENSTETISIDTNADKFQWEVSIDNGNTFNKITDNTVYTGSKTKNLQISNVLINYEGYKYRVHLTKKGNSCNEVTNIISLSINPIPKIKNSVVILEQCSDTYSENNIVNLTEAEINISDNPKNTFTYFKTEKDAISGSSQIIDIEKYPIKDNFVEAWVRTISEFNCYTISKIEINASFSENIDYSKTFEECDDFLDIDGNNTINNSDLDGISYFDFSSARQDIINTFPIFKRSKIEVSFYETAENRNASINAITDISKHRNKNNPSFAFNQTIYIKVKNKSNNFCEGIGELFLKTNSIPDFSVEGEAPDEPIIICAKNIPYTLEVKKPKDNYSYIWYDEKGNELAKNTQSIKITKGGKYSVTAISLDPKNCSKTRTIVVLKSNFEVINRSFITIIDDTSSLSSNLSIQINIPINPIINEKFKYSLEDKNGTTIRPFQESNLFNDLEGGIYNVVVENENGCGTSELEVSVIQYPKFFTPNGDGKNDYWLIKGASTTFYKTTNINIFNRFGKLLAQLPLNSTGWDGTFNGKTLPSDSYWYSIKLIPLDSTKPTINKKGNFSLLRK